MAADSKDTLRVLKLDRDYAFGEEDGVLLLIWRGQPTEDSYRERGRFMLDLAGRRPRRCGIIEVIEPSSRTPSPAARSVIAQTVLEVGKALSGVAVVVEGNELRSTLVRSVIAGMQLLIRSEWPMRVDKNLHRSAEWLCRIMQVDDPTLPPRLVQSIETLRARIPRG